jgi:Ca2+-binding EF-hand superfamily protein
LDAHEEFKAEVMEVFDMFDKEKDLTIEVAALATMLRWLKFNPTEKELQQY